MVVQNDSAKLSITHLAWLRADRHLPMFDLTRACAAFRGENRARQDAAFDLRGICILGDQIDNFGSQRQSMCVLKETTYEVTSSTGT